MLHRTNSPILFLACMLFGLLGTACVKQAERRSDQALSVPQRVVVIGPSTTATFASLGLTEKVVGVSDYCSDPNFLNTPRVGGQHDAALEKIAGLQPDFVVVQGASPNLKRWCQETGVQFKSFRTDSLDTWYQELSTLGGLFDVEEGAQELINRAKQRLLTVIETQNENHRQPLSVLLVVGRRQGEASGLVVAGEQSFLSELLAIAGGLNVVADNNRDYFDLNEEAILLLNPDVILDFLPPDDNSQELWRSAYPTLTAVKEQRVIGVTHEWTVQPGPNMPRTAEYLRDLLQSYN